MARDGPRRVLRSDLAARADEDADEGSDKSKDMWVVRLAPNAAGHKVGAAVAMLGSLDVLDCIGMDIQQDRAPKGGIQRGLEAVLEKTLGNSRRRAD